MDQRINSEVYVLKGAKVKSRILLRSVTPCKVSKEMEDRMRQRKIFDLGYLLPSGLVAQSLGQRLIKSGARGFDSRQDFFLCIVRFPISLLGLTLSRNFMGHLIKHTLQS